jgi:predicted kinase
MEALRDGVDVILDFGVWTRNERSALPSLATDIGALCELVHLAVGLDEQLERLRRRTDTESATTFDINEAELRQAAEFFVKPNLE